MHVQGEIERAFHDQRYARHGQDLVDGLDTGHALDHRHDADVAIRPLDVLIERHIAESGHATAGDAATPHGWESRGGHGGLCLRGGFEARNDDATRARIEHAADQLRIDLGHADPGLAARHFAGTDGVLQLVGDTSRCSRSSTMKS